MFKMALRANVRKKVADDDSEGESVTQGDATRKGAKRKRAKSTPCEHGVKYRSNCKVCSACPHGRRRYRCKECGGGSICEHGRQRSMCKECGGSEICEHGRQRYQCKECGGAGICEHGRRRYRCKDCHRGA